MDKKIKDFQDYVKQISPKTNLWMQMGKAFLTGGAICCVGQFIVNMATNRFGLDKDWSNGVVREHWYRSQALPIR